MTGISAFRWDVCLKLCWRLEMHLSTSSNNMCCCWRAWWVEEIFLPFLDSHESVKVNSSWWFAADTLSSASLCLSLIPVCVRVTAVLPAFKHYIDLPAEAFVCLSECPLGTICDGLARFVLPIINRSFEWQMIGIKSNTTASPQNDGFTVSWVTVVEAFQPSTKRPVITIWLLYNKALSWKTTDFTK